MDIYLHIWQHASGLFEHVDWSEENYRKLALKRGFSKPYLLDHVTARAHSGLKSSTKNAI